MLEKGEGRERIILMLMEAERGVTYRLTCQELLSKKLQSTGCSAKSYSQLAAQLKATVNWLLS
jgi:hypothetical protein